jgi:hypothetical protein
MDGFVPKPITWEVVRAALRGAVVACYPGPLLPATADIVPDVGLDHLAAAFVRDALRLVGEAMAAADAGDHERARRALHALKGLAATVGCTDIAGEAQALFDLPSVLSDRAPGLRKRIEAAGAGLACREARSA